MLKMETFEEWKAKLDTAFDKALNAPVNKSDILSAEELEDQKEYTLFTNPGTATMAGIKLQRHERAVRELGMN
ncbi:MAG: hypothetical protein WC989_02190 [Micavibrio sp.]